MPPASARDRPPAPTPAFVLHYFLNGGSDAFRLLAMQRIGDCGVKRKTPEGDQHATKPNVASVETAHCAAARGSDGGGGGIGNSSFDGGGGGGGGVSGGGTDGGSVGRGGSGGGSGVAPGERAAPENRARRCGGCGWKRNAGGGDGAAVSKDDTRAPLLHQELKKGTLASPVRAEPYIGSAWVASLGVEHGGWLELATGEPEEEVEHFPSAGGHGSRIGFPSGFG